MRDCVIVGCGRSGTSLAAGILADAGYDPGSDLLPPDEGGPKGFFESREVNRINEQLLAASDGRFTCGDGYARALRDGERWLAVLPPDVEIDEAPPSLRMEMRSALPSSPYCCKDPRFGYTLPCWRPLFGDAIFVCVFRDPAATARSISSQVRYGDLTLAFDTAFEIWKAIYSRVLERYRSDGTWIFVHYKQLFDGTGLERLASALGAALDARMADPALYRSRPDTPVPREGQRLYDELCAEARYVA
jgi:hypothetical protein